MFITNLSFNTEKRELTVYIITDKMNLYINLNELTDSSVNITERHTF